LLRQRLDGEVLIYDSRDDKVHLLDPTTACVMELLEEGWTAEGIRDEISSRLGATPSEGFLELAFAELGSAGLLVDPVATSVDLVRREVIRKAAMAGAAALLVPVITTLTATKGAAQSSGLAACAACTAPSQCLSGQCGSGGACGSNTRKPTGASCSGSTQSSANNECCSNICSATVGGTCA